MKTKSVTIVSEGSPRAVAVVEMSEQCFNCKHNDGNLTTCAAYKEGIPAKIFSGGHDHAFEYPGDGGIRFEPIS